MTTVDTYETLMLALSAWRHAGPHDRLDASEGLTHAYDAWATSETPVTHGQCRACGAICRCAFDLTNDEMQRDLDEAKQQSLFNATQLFRKHNAYVALHYAVKAIADAFEKAETGGELMYSDVRGLADRLRAALRCPIDDEAPEGWAS